MSSPGSAKLRLNFRNLPLVDAAVRASFDSPVGLTFRCVNDLAERLRPDFPQLSELDHFQVPPGVRDPSMTLGPGRIPGADYSGNKDGLSITVQSQVIVARWVKKLAQARPIILDSKRWPTRSGAQPTAVARRAHGKLRAS